MIQLMNESPWLTFGLFLILAGVINKLIDRNKPNINCQCHLDDEDDDE